MTERDPVLTRALDLLVPAASVSARPEHERAWSRILEIAGKRKPRRRLSVSSRRAKVVAVAVALVIATAIALPASGLVREWFLGGQGSPEPIGPVVTVTTGSTGGAAWSLKAYASKTDGVCVVIDSNGNGAEGCGGGVRGEPVTPESKNQHPNAWVGFMQAGLPGTGTSLVVGPVAVGVASVTVSFSDGSEDEATIVPPPSGPGLDVAFYVLPNPSNARTTAVTARDQNGATLQRLPVDIPSIVPEGPGTPTHSK